MDLKSRIDGIKLEGEAYISEEYADQLETEGQDTLTDTQQSVAEKKNRISESGNEASSEMDSAVNSDASNEQDSELSESEPPAGDEPSEDSVSEDNAENLDVQKALEGYAKKKIGKLTRKVHESNDELRELRQELDRLRLQQQNQSFTDSSPALPMVNDFEYLDPQTKQKVLRPQASDYNGDAPAYLEACAKFDFAAKQMKQFWHKAQTEYYAAEQRKVDYQHRIEAGKRQYKDFGEVLKNSDQDLYRLEQAQPGLVPAIQKSPYAEHLVYYLAKNPDVRTELAHLDHDDMLKTLGKMEAVIETRMTPNIVSKAPPPISPKSSSAVTRKTISKDASSQDEINAIIRERMRQGR